MRQDGFRNRVIWYNYILCILVILIHTENTTLFTNAVPFLNMFEYVVVEKIARAAVASFFLCSGYLFYRNFSMDMVMNKWKSRWRSLVIPYLSWNLIYYLISLFVSKVPVLNRFYPEEIPVNFEELLQAVLLCKYNEIFWFLQFLIIYVAVCPALYLLVKNKGIGIITIVLILILADSQILVQNHDVLAAMVNWLFIYLTGAYAGVHLKQFVESPRQPLPGFFLAATMTITFFLLLEQTPALGVTLLYYLGVSIFLWEILCVLDLPPAKSWMGISFYIYATHFMIVRFGNKMVCQIFGESMYYGVLAFLLLPVAALAFAGITAVWLSRYTPFLWRLLSGNRKITSED